MRKQILFFYIFFIIVLATQRDTQLLLTDIRGSEIAMKNTTWRISQTIMVSL